MKKQLRLHGQQPFMQQRAAPQTCVCVFLLLLLLCFIFCFRCFAACVKFSARHEQNNAFLGNEQNNANNEMTNKLDHFLSPYGTGLPCFVLLRRSTTPVENLSIPHGSLLLLRSSAHLYKQSNHKQQYRWIAPWSKTNRMKLKKKGGTYREHLSPNYAYSTIKKASTCLNGVLNYIKEISIPI